MNSFRHASPRFWILNFVLTLTVAAAHFCLYTCLCDITFAAGQGGRSVSPWLPWLVVALGFPAVPLGTFLLALPPHSIRGPLMGHDGTSYFYLLAGINALLCGLWTTVQFRVVPSLIYAVRRYATSRLASLGA